MPGDCLPFSAVPHTSRLYTDYLADFERVQRYYAAPPLARDWYGSQAATLRYDSDRRARVGGVLERQNRAWGASDRTFANLRRFRAGAAAAVTGQQVTLFGGPLFALYKAMTAIKVAEQATAAGVDTVPVFWLATEDHDLAEVSKTFLLAPDGNLHGIESTASGPANAPISAVRFGDEVARLTGSARDLLGDAALADVLAAAYRPGATFGDAFARLFAHIFRDYGIILLDPSDAELHQVAASVYRAAIVGAADLDRELLERGRALESAGYQQQVKVTPSSTLVFAIDGQARVPIHRANGDFTIGQNKLSAAEVLARIASEPEKFSANVLLRPVVQDHLLPTLAYVGGPAEVAYFAQAEVVYRELLGRVTPVLPRLHAFLIEPRIERLLEKYRLGVADTFQGIERLRERMAAGVLPNALEPRFAAAEQAVSTPLDEIVAELSKLDPTAAEAARKRVAKIRYQLGRIRQRAGRSEQGRCREIDHHASLLGNALYPNKNLQEREIAGISLLARHDAALLDRLHDLSGRDCADYHLIRL